MTDVHHPESGSRVAVIGAGPAGLMAAEVLANHGVRVDVFDAMPSAGRKFLMAGKGGMNITHSEAADAFLSRYGTRRTQIAPLLAAFDAEALREWVHGLGIETFVGTSGRVFPREMKAAPLLRAWLHRLREARVSLHMRHRWQGRLDAIPVNGWRLAFMTPEGEQQYTCGAVVLALGGASWARLGSDGAWLPWLRARDVSVADMQPANCGFDVAWSAHFRERFAGEALKSVTASCVDTQGVRHMRRGECMVTEQGIEGGLIYALSAMLRDRIAMEGEALLEIDLVPDRDMQRVHDEVSHPRGSRSMSSHLQSRIGLKGVKTALLRECLPATAFSDMGQLAHGIKSLSLRLLAPRPIDEAISSAGGVRFEAMDETLMLQALPGVFCAGEMLDWEAPTGGYLLTACFASGRVAGLGAVRHMQSA